MSRAPLIPEKTFPRGGAKPKKLQKRINRSSFNSKSNKIKKKKINDREKKTNGNETNTTFVKDLTSIKDLTASIISDGMVILGSILTVKEKFIQFSFPGGFRANVTAAKLSSEYWKRIKNGDAGIKFLPEMYSIDELYPVKILSRDEKNSHIFYGTLDPQEINLKINARNVQSGMILPAAITSKEEHGYIVNIGIGNLNAFLSNDKVPKKASYCEGQVIRCVVLKANGHSVFLSMLQEDLDTASLKSPVPLDCFVPGMSLLATVEKVFKSGLEVSLPGYDKALKGYISVNHLKKLFDNPLNYELGSTLTVDFLYTVPLLNFPFFRMHSQEAPSWSLPFGTIISGEVIRVSGKGLTLKVGENDKCFVPVAKVDQSKLLAPHERNLKTRFHVGDNVQKVRIASQARFLRHYLGALDKKSLNSPIFSVADLKLGKVLPCRITVVGEKYCTADLGNSLKGYIFPLHMSDNPSKKAVKLKEGQSIKGRIIYINKDERIVHLTLKPSLVHSKDPILKKYKQVRHEVPYLGTICAIYPNKLSVIFYGGVKGTVDRKNAPIDSTTPLSTNYYVGQVVKCYVISGDKTRGLRLSLVYSGDIKKVFKIGNEYSVVVESIVSDGVYVEALFQGVNKCQGFIPFTLLSCYSSLVPRLLSLLTPGYKFKAYCIHIDALRSPPLLFTSHSIIASFLKKKSEDPFRVGNILPFFCLPTSENKHELTPPVEPLENFQFSQYSNVNSRRDAALGDFSVILGKIKNINPPNVYVSTDVKEVWDHHFMSSLKDLNEYLEEIDKLQEKFAAKNDSYRQFFLGKQVSAVCESVKEDISTLKVQNSFNMQFCCSKKISVGSKLKGIIMWIDFSENVAWLHPSADDVEVETREKRSNVRARIVHVCKDVVVAKALGSNELLFIPTRRHWNDRRTYEDVYTVGEMTKLRVFRLSKRLLGIDKQIASKEDKVQSVHDKKKLNDLPQTDQASAPKKRKIMKTVDDDKTWDADVESNYSAWEDTRGKRKSTICSKDLPQDEDSVCIEFVKEGTGESCPPVKQEVVSDEETPMEVANDKDEDPDLEVKEEVEDEVTNILESSNQFYSSSDDDDSNSEKKSKTSLDVGFNWAVADNLQLLSANSKARADESSSDDEIPEDKAEKKKKKRLSGIEKRDKAKATEEKLRSLEESRLDPSKPPQTADDFDRLVMASPDDSSIWLQYMAHHIENTEIEKARAVARRALKVINLREEQEKLNIWFALMNLEQLYGSPESQKHVFDEAVRCNDAYKVHLQKLNMIANNAQSLEVEKMANAMLKKFKENESIWWEVGGLLMKVGKVDAARNVLQRGMASLPTTKHVNLITRFAQMENKYGSHERAQTLYEHVLSSFPKRIDVWSSYADLMIKSNQIDLARQILERATSQSLPPKKMKVLYKKFVSFEETHGTPKDAERVRTSAAEYLDSVTGND